MLALAPPLTHSHSSTTTATTTRAVRPLPRKQGSSSFITTSASAPPPPSSSSSSSATVTVTTHVPGALSRGSSAHHVVHPRLPSGSNGTSAASSTPSAGPSSLTAKARSPPPGPSPRTAGPAQAPPAPAPPPAVDIHTFDPQELLRLLASLLTQIATTNDGLGEPPAPSPADEAPRGDAWAGLTSASKGSLGTRASALQFHARNVPTISLEAYLLRILKYCPTTNEVFLSLLVYFDRMSRLVQASTGRSFVIDSYNVHRLVIAGVTVASKFFSDVFYTNSRYAKVGGLPQSELNELELKFLELNDFRLTIHPEEMQRYAEQLIIVSAPPSASPSPAPAPAPAPPPAAPVLAPAQPTHSPAAYADFAGGPQAMGAIDAYGGRLPSDDAYVRTRSRGGSAQTSPRTPGASRPHHPVRTPSTASSAAPSVGTDCESDAGTEGGETDDEPTIRPAQSVCSDASSVWEDGDGAMGSP